MSADAKDVKAANINVQSAVLMTVEGTVAWCIFLPKSGLIAIAVSVGWPSVESPVAEVRVGRNSVAAAVSVTVAAVVTVMNSVATVMPVTGFRGRGK